MAGSCKFRKESGSQVYRIYVSLSGAGVAYAGTTTTVCTCAIALPHRCNAPIITSSAQTDIIPGLITTAGLYQIIYTGTLTNMDMETTCSI